MRQRAASPTHPQADPDELARLVADAAGGDEAAWEQIVVLYGRRIYALAKSRLGDPETAEEITQSVFATLADRLSHNAAGYTEKGRFEPWLFRIAMNRVRDEGRRRVRRNGRIIPIAAVDPAAHPAASHPDAGDAEQLTALRDAIARLDDRDREIIELRHHAALPFAQIAETLNEPMGTVLARHHRALKKIRRDLEARGLADPDHTTPDLQTPRAKEQRHA